MATRCKVTCNEQVFEYYLTRKPVKNINLRIKTDGKIYVSASRWVSIKVIESFIYQKQAWILRALARGKSRGEQELTMCQYVDGETYRFMGAKIILKVIESSQEEVMLTRKNLVLQVKNAQDVKRKEKLIDNWFRAQCQEIFDEIAHNTQLLFEKYKIQHPTIKLRKMKSRWGTCQYRNGVIILNIRLIEKPREYIEYVMVHEFAHFIVPNHSQEFYQVVESVMPDWKGIILNDKKEKKDFDY